MFRKFVYFVKKTGCELIKKCLGSNTGNINLIQIKQWQAGKKDTNLTWMSHEKCRLQQNMGKYFH